MVLGPGAKEPEKPVKPPDERVVARQLLQKWPSMDAVARKAAVPTLVKALHIDDEDIRLGIALAKKGQLDDAIAEYREAIRLKKDNLGAHGNLGNALLGKGQLDEAIAEYREVIRLKKDDALAHRHLGNTLQMKRTLDRLPSILKGEAQPADAADCVVLATFCQQPFK